MSLGTGIYDVVQALSLEFSIKRLCEVLEVSRSPYYTYINEQSYVLKSEKKRVSEAISRIFKFHKRRYGWRRIKDDLKEEGIEAGRHQICSRMREQNLIAIQPKSFVPQTTQSNPHIKRSPNLLLEEKNLPSAPRQVIVGDITYLPNQEREYGK